VKKRRGRRRSRRCRGHGDGFFMSLVLLLARRIRDYSSWTRRQGPCACGWGLVDSNTTVG